MHIEGLDEIDNKILEIIKENARLTYKEIGDQVGISRVSVKNRMDLMQEKGIIQGYQTVIDPTRIPEGTKFFLDIEMAPDYFNEVAEYLADNKMIRQIYTVTGECRIHAIGFAVNKRNLEHFVNVIYQSRKGVHRVSCHTILSTLMDRDGGVEYVRYQEPDSVEEGGTETDIG